MVTLRHRVRTSVITLAPCQPPRPSTLSPSAGTTPTSVS